MVSRSTALAALVTALVFTATTAQAEITLGGARYSDADEQSLIESCRGLDAQSRMSLIADVPDDIESPDRSSEWALAKLPFTLADCRRAGLV